MLVTVNQVVSRWRALMRGLPGLCTCTLTIFQRVCRMNQHNQNKRQKSKKKKNSRSYFDILIFQNASGQLHIHYVPQTTLKSIKSGYPCTRPTKPRMLEHYYFAIPSEIIGLQIDQQLLNTSGEMLFKFLARIRYESSKIQAWW